MPRPNPSTQAKRLKFSSSLNVVFDGNSIVSGSGVTAGVDDYPTKCAALTPMSGSGATFSNVGVGGRQWPVMTSSGVANAAWLTGKTNVAATLETTNALGNVSNATVESVLLLLSQYYASLRAAHPWVIVHVTTPPMGFSSIVTDQSTRDYRNGLIRQLDLAVMAQPAAYGVDVVCDVRQVGSPFAFADYLPQRWTDTSSLWSAGELSTYGAATHMSVAGYAALAGIVAAKLARLPRNAHQ